MKPPRVFDPSEVPEGWRLMAEHIICCIPGAYRVSICCNNGKFWDYHLGYPSQWTTFDASGCNTLAEVCALVEVLRRMS